MGALALLLILVGATLAWVYVKFPPQHDNKAQIAVFDRMVLGVCAVLIVIWVLAARGRMLGSAEEPYWPIIAAIGALGIEIVFLGGGFLLRNFYVFKPPRLGRR